MLFLRVYAHSVSVFSKISTQIVSVFSPADPCLRVNKSVPCLNMKNIPWTNANVNRDTVERFPLDSEDVQSVRTLDIDSFI